MISEISEPGGAWKEQLSQYEKDIRQYLYLEE